MKNEKIFYNPNFYFALIVLFILLFAMFFLTKLIKKTGNNEIDTTKVNKKNLSYSDENAYTRLADRVKSAFEGIGTDTIELEDIFINFIKTKDDFELLKLKFGIKKISHLLGSYEGNLTQHLIYELEDNQKTKQKIFSHLNKIGVLI